MKHTSAIVTRRNKRIISRLHRIQGQLASLERALNDEANIPAMLQTAAAARGAMSGLMADLMEERLLSLQAATEDGEMQIEFGEMIDMVRGYLA